MSTLPGRHFLWRIRGNPLSWWKRLPGETPDLILATSMVDLATLKGLEPRLAQVPTIYYFHENQFAYPMSDAQVKCIEPQMVQLYGALAADRIVFNSAYNRDSFFAGAETLLNRVPDQVPQGIVDKLAGKAAVLPVPIRPFAGRGMQPATEKMIVWNHRWEYDKAPEVFAEAMTALARRRQDFRVALLGARPSQPPDALLRLRDILGGQIVIDDKVERRDYEQILVDASIVVSTAIHEFQGLAVMEAVAAGCRPLVPDNLCYREQYPDECRYPARDSRALSERLDSWLDGELPASVDIDAWTEHRLLPCWKALLAGQTDMSRQL